MPYTGIKQHQEVKPLCSIEATDSLGSTLSNTRNVLIQMEVRDVQTNNQSSDDSVKVGDPMCKDGKPSLVSKH